ncbi:MAG: carbonic anhydrase [Patescibacteria group bacterium]
MENNKIFACAINCMDGRVQDVVKNYMKENYGVNYVDMITEPGPNKILASPELAEGLVENIKKRVEVSVHHHGSKVVAIVGHDGCAGNPATKEEQIKHLQKAKEAVENFGMGVDVVLLYVNGDWTTVEKI